jgi:oligopeptide transport system substrate-binding protein
LESTLGLKVNYYSLPFKNLLTNRGAVGASGLLRSGWGADYPSPGNILGPLLSTSAIGTTDPTMPATGDNPGRYSNPVFDRLLDQARATMDEAERMALYRQAERIAIGEDLALIPLWYRYEYRLADTNRFTNLRIDWHGNAELSVISLR